MPDPIDQNDGFRSGIDIDPREEDGRIQNTNNLNDPQSRTGIDINSREDPED